MVRKSIDFKPIGEVISSFKNHVQMKENKNWREKVSKIKVYREYVEGLHGIEEYSHLWIIYHLDRIKISDVILSSPYLEEKELEKIGIFATRYPERPNPIGITIIQLIEKKRDILIVKNLDALDKSLILDIKPYDNLDIINDIRTHRRFKSRFQKNNQE